MKKSSLFLPGVIILLSAPVLACSLITDQQVTPTPTKTPKRVRLVPRTPTTTATLIPLQTPTPVLEAPADSLTPEPPTDTPVPEEPPTDTPTPEPPPTNTPLPPPPTPIPPPPPPTNTPAPPPPTQPPANLPPDVIIELPKGNTYDPGDDITLVIIVRDPDGVVSFTWGVFTQNQTPLVGGEQQCGNAPECRIQEELTAPPISGTYLAGADAVDTKGALKRGVGEIYVR